MRDSRVPLKAALAMAPRNGQGQVLDLVAEADHWHLAAAEGEVYC